MNNLSNDPRLTEFDLDSSEEAGGFDIRQVWFTVDKHKWAVLGLTILITLITALFVYREIPVYRSTTTLLVERVTNQVAPVEDVFSNVSDHWLYYQTQYDLIKRRNIGQRVVDSLQLHTRPPPPAQTGFTWRSLLPDEWFPAPPQPTQQQRYEQAIGWVVGATNVNPKRNTQLVDVSFDSTDPNLAAEVANAVAQAYIEDQLEGRLEMARSASSFLTQSLIDLKNKLDESEAALQAFKQRERLNDGSLANQELQIATDKLSEARTSRVDAQVRYEQVRDAKTTSGQPLANSSVLLTDPQVNTVHSAFVAAQRNVTELGKRYGPKHPRMISAVSELESATQALDRQVAVVADGIQREFEARQAAERAAQADLDAVKERYRDIQSKQFELQRLERDVETNREIYGKFQTQFKETDVSDGFQTANARVVEAARPAGFPIKPNKRRSLSLAFVIGLMCSLGLAFLLEHLDNTVKNARDAERLLGMPVLGVLPKLKTSGRTDLSPLRYFSENISSVFAEAIRTVRTGVLLSSLDHQHKIVLVTSSVPSEGKTTLSMNLARAMGEMKKVLLIDADMRRPMVATALSGKADDKGARKGLSHFIAGEATLAECLHKISTEETLYVMSAGTVPPNPLEMLSSQRFSHALEQLAERFEHIVIDCAPALVVSDAMVLSKMASAVVYVIKSDATPAQAAKSGLKRLSRVGAHVIGIVVNQAQRKTKAYYGKYGYGGDQYYGEYGYYQRDDDKKRG